MCLYLSVDKPHDAIVESADFRVDGVLCLT
jgi:hypothetical protein